MKETLPIPRTVNAEAAAYPAMPFAPPAPPAASQAYLSAFRRHWLLVIVLGILCGGAAATAVWRLRGPGYTARALLRVATSEQQLVFDTAERASAETFMIYKSTQQQLIRSDFVLLAALRNREVAALPVVQAQSDPVAWLANQLEVEFPGDAEVMQIELTGDDPEAAAALVTAVVDAYMNEVVNVERDDRRSRLDELDRIYADKEVEMRNKRIDLKHLAEQLGSGDTEALSVKQQITLQQFAELRRETTRLELELRRLQTQLSIKQAAFESPERLTPTPLEINMLADKDHATTQLTAMRDTAGFLVSETDQRVQPGRGADHAGAYQSQLEYFDQQIADRREQLRQELEHGKRIEVKQELAELKAELEIVTQQHAAAMEDLNAARKQAEEVGGSSIEVEMMRAEIAHLENVLTPIAEEREHVRVELRSAPRISVLQRAEVPRAPQQAVRLQLSAFAGMLAFGLPAFGILLLDVRSRRISRSDEVSEGLGLAVLGTVPRIPYRAIRQSRTARQQHWRALMNEAVDGVALRILREAEQQPMQLLLISSAASGEGKTTLATQLALSLARLGRRTLLVDCDLRKPALNGAFGLPLEPGVSDLLTGASTLEEVVHATGFDNLWLVAAGHSMQHGLSSLTGEAIEQMLGPMRQGYEFVVVDTCPILPVADTRAVARHADAVILSVLRDVSQAPQVQATWRILTALGVWNIGAVVTGSTQEIYYRSGYGYDSYVRA
ncbi:MAG: AAA family ATPase [Rhodopirellula sp.]|nr:AAA family ATPase [Rhodopirellula sp.]